MHRRGPGVDCCLPAKLPRRFVTFRENTGCHRRSSASALGLRAYCSGLDCPVSAGGLGRKVGRREGRSGPFPQDRSADAA
jgi:hypothetical protein